MAEHTTNSDLIYVGTEVGGLWRYSRSLDRSVLLGTDQLEKIGVAEIAVHPTNGDILYIGTGCNFGFESGQQYKTLARRSSSGIYLSVTGGNAWSQILSWDNPVWYDACNAPDEIVKRQNYLQISRILISESNPSVLLIGFRSYDDQRCNACANGFGNYGKAGGGILRSVDGGANWSVVRSGLKNEFIWDMEVDPVNPQTVYASGHRVYRSDNFGLTWIDVSANLTNLYTILDTVTCGNDLNLRNYVSLTVPPKGSLLANHVAALVVSFSSKALFASSSGFTTPVEQASGTIPSSIEFSARMRTFGVNKTFDKFFFGGRYFKSAMYSITTNILGSGMTPSLHPHLDILEILVSSNALFPDQVLLGTDGGFEISNDNASIFSNHSYGMSTMQLYSVSASSKSQFVIGGTQDNDAIFSSDYYWYESNKLGDGGDVAINPNGEEIAYCYDYQTSSRFSRIDFSVFPQVPTSIQNYNGVCRVTVSPMEAQPLLRNEIYLARPDDTDDFTIGKYNI